MNETTSEKVMKIKLANLGRIYPDINLVSNINKSTTGSGYSSLLQESLAFIQDPGLNPKHQKL